MEECKINIKDNTLQWREIRPKTKISRRSYCTSCIYSHKLYVYGGVDIGEEQFGNIHSIIINDIMPSWQQESIIGTGVPTSISRHAAELISNKWFISGGECRSDSSNKIFSINLDTLNAIVYTIHGDNLPKIDSHTMNYIETDVNKLLVLIGGFQNNSKANKVFTLDYSEKNSSLNCKYIKSIGIEPSARSNHSTIVFKSAIYLFGGINEDGLHLNDLWKWKEGKWEEIKATHSPVGRGCHSAVEYNGLMYIWRAGAHRKGEKRCSLL
jgi:Galactose oxidase, central domain